MMIPDGKNSFPKLLGDEKETMAKKKGKQVLIADSKETQNLIMGNGFKERQGSGKAQLQSRHVNFHKQIKGVWKKQQQKPKKDNNPSKETVAVFGKEAEPVLERGNIEKENSILILENGEHSGTVNSNDNGKGNPHKESVPIQDFENPSFPNTNLVVEIEEHVEQNGCDLPKASTDDQVQQNGDVPMTPLLVNKYAELDPFPSLIVNLPFPSKAVQHPTSREMPNCQHPSLDSTFLVEHQYACQEGTLIVMDDECGLHRTTEPPDRGFYSEDELTSRGDEGLVSDTQELESDTEQRQELSGVGNMVADSLANQGALTKVSSTYSSPDT
ncbi:unnamed protein product, partial [Ilex paraguariensis]